MIEKGGKAVALSYSLFYFIQFGWSILEVAQPGGDPGGAGSVLSLTPRDDRRGRGNGTFEFGSVLSYAFV